ncbi:hypothetical protein [Crenalkalicoccus roseus]|uniref:hypothetical protein n=1 Tax=Crenalkalicoccus roseus TaxID=1485588 RepID=UPI00130517E1|nr:hypothetical protein [Crenalkalicoccus roseus]
MTGPAKRRHAIRLLLAASRLRELALEVPHATAYRLLAQAEAMEAEAGGDMEAAMHALREAAFYARMEENVG